MAGKIHTYQTIVFDCDGVILNSNKIKTQAFYQVALPYGEAQAQTLVDYHVRHGGISRYQKFAWFIERVLQDRSISLDSLLTAYAQTVQKALLECEVADGLFKLKEQTKHANWLVCSGADQAELRQIFALRQLDKLFDGGIFGSPDDKKMILSKQINNRNIQQPALFIGDSRYDHKSAMSANLDFIFLSKWSEFGGWQNYQKQHGFDVYTDIKALLV